MFVSLTMIQLFFWSSNFNARVPETMPLYDILNEFQKGHSHMAVVVRQYDKAMSPNPGPAGSKFILFFVMFFLPC